MQGDDHTGEEEGDKGEAIRIRIIIINNKK
jgi:hypothetical protein